MVKLVDLDEALFQDLDGHGGGEHGEPREDALPIAADDRPNPNYALPFAAALSCYPIISQLAGYVDLNTLHELSRTCRQFRANLLEYRNLLIEQTLRCENETADPAQVLGNALSASVQQWRTYGQDGTKIDRISSGKVGACARDMVGECRRCARMVCRNCVMKRPLDNVIAGRHRRLCRTCMKCPLERLLVQSEARRQANAIDLLTLHVLIRDSDEAGDPPQCFPRSPCACPAFLWICQPCSQYLRSHDTTYMRGWTWRTRYSVCGGMGAGLGEGNEGVQCGRGSHCLAKTEVVREVECDANELSEQETAGRERSQRPPLCRRWQGSGYSTSEIVGIGGNLKLKLREKVKVGAIVKEYEDERATCKDFLKREQDGLNRSWCSWCNRVIPGRKDLDGAARSSESVSSSSSAGSSTLR